MNIAIGSDHAGYELKEGLKKYFDKNKIKYQDFGTHSLDSVDYPFYGRKVGEAIVSKDNKFDFGIVICGTGIGISIAANKVPGVRAALVYDEFTAKLAREHNNANIIALGGRTTSIEKAVKIVETFMNSKFENRHQRRIDEISLIEKEENNG